MAKKVTEGLSKLTTIDTKALDRLIDLGECVIVDSILEGMATKESPIEVDVGIGTLTVQILDDSVRYRFSPSAKFGDDVGNAIRHGANPLDKRVESALVDKFINTYKDLL